VKSTDRVNIEIVGWDKRQYPLKGRGEGRPSQRRSWIALSVDLFSDPDFLELNDSDRLMFIALLTHAGKVGKRFSMSIQTARKLFSIRRCKDFDHLINQGLIKTWNPTVQDSTGHNMYINKEAANAADEDPEETKKPLSIFEEFFQAYPLKKTRSQSEQYWEEHREELDPKLDCLIMDVKKRTTSDRQWLDGYIPHPFTYLNQEVWRDDIELVRAKNTGLQTAAPPDPQKIKQQQEREVRQDHLANLQGLCGIHLNNLVTTRSWDLPKCQDYIAQNGLQH